MSAYSKNKRRKRHGGLQPTFLEDFWRHILQTNQQGDNMAYLRELLTPGVPQISVNIFNFSSSMILLKPKSAIMMSASSCGVLNRRFSGFKSDKSINIDVWWTNGGVDIPRWTMPESWRYLTALKIVLTREAASLFWLIKTEKVGNLRGLTLHSSFLLRRCGRRALRRCRDRNRGKGYGPSKDEKGVW